MNAYSALEFQRELESEQNCDEIHHFVKNVLLSTPVIFVHSSGFRGVQGDMGLTLLGFLFFIFWNRYY